MAKHTLKERAKDAPVNTQLLYGGRTHADGSKTTPKLTRPESRFCVISCSVESTDLRIKWWVQESFRSLSSSLEAFCNLFGEGFVLGYASVKLVFNLKTQNRCRTHAGILRFQTYLEVVFFVVVFCQAGTNTNPSRRQFWNLWWIVHLFHIYHR